MYALGDKYVFNNVPLEDCGDGWDWRAPNGLRYWLPEGLRFEVRDGDAWNGIGAVEVHHRSGRVGFARCLFGMEVRASGVCYTSSFLAEGEKWQLIVEEVLSGGPQLGADDVFASAKGDMYVLISGVQVEPTVESVLAWLPFGNGVFVGEGEAKQLPAGVEVTFNEEGVQYVPR